MKNEKGWYVVYSIQRAVNEAKLKTTDSSTLALNWSRNIIHDDELKLDHGLPLILVILQNTLLQVSLRHSLYEEKLSDSRQGFVLSDRIYFSLFRRTLGRVCDILWSCHRYSNGRFGLDAYPAHAI